MANTNQIGLEAIFENADFQKGIDEYNSSVSSASKNTESSSSAMSAAWDGMAAIGAVAFETIAAGVGLAVVALYSAVDAALDTEEVMTRMEFIVGNVGERTGVASEDVLALADSMSQIYPIDDEVITSAITMGLTFDGVNKDNIQPLLGASADLAAFTGKTLPATMKELALAISDPEKAARLLKDANITLSDSEMDVLKGFKETGDSAGATTFLLDKLKEKGILGLGEAMGDTAKGKMTIMQTALGNLQESLGAGLMDSLKGVFDRITVFANDPRTVEFFTSLGEKIGDFAEGVIDSLPSIMTMFDNLAQWFSDNEEVVIGILAAIGVAMLIFAATAISAAASAALAMLPVIAAVAAVGVVAAVLYKAWKGNWGGIRTALQDAWKKVKPVFESLKDWLAVQVPKAIKSLSDFWTNVLLPAIKKVFEWIAKNVIPTLADVVVWLGTNVPKAIKTLSDFWTNTLLPAIKAVANFLTTVVFPALQTLYNWLATSIVNATKTLSAIWNNVFLPALRAVQSFISGTLIPIFNTIVSVMNGVFSAALRALSTIWNTVLLPAIRAVHSFISGYIVPLFQAVANLADAVLGLAIRVLAGIWQNVLQPALSAVWSYLSSKIIPIFNSIATTANGVLSGAIRALSDLWNNVLLPAIKAVLDKLSPLADFLRNVLYDAFNKIKEVIQWVIDKINALIDALNNLELPSWLIPGSPTPLELGLRGINEEMKRLAQASIPAIQHEMNVLNSPRDVAGSSRQASSNSVSTSSQRTNNYLFGASFNVSDRTGMIEILQGLS